jgi:hypothetical protein
MYTAGNIIERGVTAAERLEHAGYGGGLTLHTAYLR